MEHLNATVLITPTSGIISGSESEASVFSKMPDD